MTEFISRKYGDEGYEVISKTDSEAAYKSAEEFARKLIDHAKPVTDNNVGGKWISVKDRLPEKDGDYLIYATVPFNGRKFIATMHYEKGAYLPIWSDTTHWMPLPEPPEVTV